MNKSHPETPSVRPKSRVAPLQPRGGGLGVGIPFRVSCIWRRLSLQGFIRLHMLTHTHAHSYVHRQYCDLRNTCLLCFVLSACNTLYLWRGGRTRLLHSHSNQRWDTCEMIRWTQEPVSSLTQLWVRVVCTRAHTYARTHKHTSHRFPLRNKVSSLVLNLEEGTGGKKAVLTLNNLYTEQRQETVVWCH